MKPDFSDRKITQTQIDFSKVQSKPIDLTKLKPGVMEADTLITAHK
jgi:hypothetical protein